MSMKAGDLRCPIRLMKPTSSVNAKGRKETAWEELPTIFAAKADVSGREFWQAQAYNAEDIVTYTIRYRTDVDVTWRIKDHGKILNILEVNHMGYMQDYIRLKCREVRAGGA